MVTIQPSDRADAVPGVMTKLTQGYSLTFSISSVTCRVTVIVAYRLPNIPVQWLTDNGSAYTAHETRKFAVRQRVESGAMHNSGEQPGNQRNSRKLREDDKTGLHRNHVESGQPGCGDEFGSGVHSLQQTSSA